MEIVCLPENLDLRTLSHELRTPLVPILGITHHILKTEELTSTLRDSIKNIFEAGNRLLELANKMAKIKKLATDNSLTDEELQTLIQQIQGKNKAKTSNFACLTKTIC